MGDTLSMKSALHNTYHAANQSERDKLIVDNLDYVGRILSTMTFYVEDPDERQNLLSAGVLGLVEAATKFDKDKGIPFQTFAYPRIRGAIVDELRAASPHSQAVLKNIGKIKRARETLEPPLTPEKLAKETGLSIETVVDTLTAMRTEESDQWTDLSDDVYTLWDKSVASPNQQAEMDELAEVMADAIEQLDERKRLILTLYYYEQLNMSEIGVVLDLSESRVSKILAECRIYIQEVIRCKTQ